MTYTAVANNFFCVKILIIELFMIFYFLYENNLYTIYYYFLFDYFHASLMCAIIMQNTRDYYMNINTYFRTNTTRNLNKK